MRFSSVLPVILLSATAIATPLFASAAVTTPGNLSIEGGKYTNDNTPTFTWSKVSGAEKYDYRVNNGSYVGVRQNTSVTLDTLRDGWYTIYVRAHKGDQWSSPTSYTFEVDATGPAVSDIAATSAQVGQTVTLSVTATSDAWISSCRLSVNDAVEGEMTRGSSNVWRIGHAFATSGSQRVAVMCVDGDGNTGTSRTTRISVGASSAAEAGDVIKELSSPTVYYYGKDGKRHAFPTESVFRSWYASFGDVITVPSSFLMALPLGESVTVRPGSRLVKFQSAANVYAVGMGAKLYHYANEAAVKLDYGSNWQSALISLPDVLRSGYTLWRTIDDANDFDVRKELQDTTTIDELF